MYITYDEMSPAMQKAYRSTNAARKVTLFLSLTLIVIVFFAVIIGFGDGMNFQGFIAAIPVAAGCGCAIGGLVHGLVHCEFAFKWLFKNLPLILALAGCLGLYLLGAFIGVPVIIVDLVLFIKKKPLVYSFEHKHFFMLKSVQNEMEAAMYMEAAEAARSESVAEKLSNLNKLKAEGTITEEEYSTKKAELLEKI